jgi:hypothetical protein
MKVTIMEYLLANNLSCTSLKKYIVWKDDRSPPVHFEKCMDVLDEIQLFIARRRPEVRTFDTIIVFSFFPIFCREFMGTLRPKGRIRDDDFVSGSWIFDETISDTDRTLCLSETMEKHIHQGDTSRLSDELLTTKYFCFEFLLFISIEFSFPHFEDIVMCFEEESTRTRTRIVDRRFDTWSHHFDHCSYEHTGSKVLTRSRLHIFCHTSEERFIDLTLHIYSEHIPLDLPDL